MGGFVGAVSRYLVSGWVQAYFSRPFPLGTMAVNIIGSLILGLMAGLTQAHIVSQGVRLFVSIGLLGAFTTFSTFSYETLMLMRSGSIFEGFLNIAVSLILGLLMVFIGYSAGQAI
ncbi:MAG: fluoride efflux transporter CrcB [bacterium]|nr:fluoride efflux transporter CrcB [bacterium]